MAFKKGISGNVKGRPKGNKTAARLREAIMGELPDVITVLLALAKGGDTTAAKLLLDRALPPLRPQAEAVRFDIASNDTLASTGQSIIDGVSRGEIQPDIGAQLITALANQSKIIEIDELIQRIEALEQSK